MSLVMALVLPLVAATPADAPRALRGRLVIVQDGKPDWYPIDVLVTVVDCGNTGITDDNGFFTVYLPHNSLPPGQEVEILTDNQEEYRIVSPARGRLIIPSELTRRVEVRMAPVIAGLPLPLVAKNTVVAFTRDGLIGRGRPVDPERVAESVRDAARYYRVDEEDLRRAMDAWVSENQDAPDPTLQGVARAARERSRAVALYLGLSWHRLVPKGAIPLTADQAARLQHSFRLVTLWGRLTEVTAVNGLGQSTPSPSPPSFLAPRDEGYWSPAVNPVSWKYAYQGGRVAAVEATDALGRPVYRLVYSYDIAHPETVVGRFENRDGSPAPQSKVGVTQLELTVESTSGDVRRVRFLDRNGLPAMSDASLFGWQYHRGGGGRLESATQLGPDGNPLVFPDGCLTLQYTYDERGRVSRTSWMNAGGEINRGHGPTPVEEFEYDRQGNTAAHSYKDALLRPAESKQGYAAVRYEYDASGDLTREQYFDARGRPTPLADGYAEVRHSYAPSGAHIASSYHDESGGAALLPEGYSRVRIEHGDGGRAVTYAYLDRTGAPVTITGGYAALRRMYDATGRLVREDDLDRLGNLAAVTSSGYARQECLYPADAGGDDRGALYRTGVVYFGADGKRARLTSGISAVLWEYDANHAVLAEWYEDASGRATENFNVARILYTYTSFNGAAVGPSGNGPPFTLAPSRTVREAYFNMLGQPTTSSQDCTSVTSEFDSHGRLSRKLLEGFPEDRRYSKLEQLFDVGGHLVAKTYQNAMGKPVKNRQKKFARKELRYEGGRLTLERFLDDGNPPRLVNNEDGIARITRSYDDGGHLTEEAFFDRSDHLMDAYTGFARRTQTWDPEGRILSRSYWDRADQPARGASGYVSRRYSYDNPGRVEETTIGEAGWPSPAVRRVFDERNNLVGETSLGRDDEPVMGPQGYAGWAATFDARGNWTGLEYRDPSDRPCRTPARGLPRSFLNSGGPFPEPFRPYFRRKGEFFPIDLEGPAFGFLDRGFSLARAIVCQEYMSIAVGYESDGLESARWPERPAAVQALLRQLVPLLGGGGWSRIALEYRVAKPRGPDFGAGSVTVTYLDERGNPTSCRYGYRTVGRTMDPRVTAWSDRFEEFPGLADGQDLVRAYDGLGRIVEERVEAGGRPAVGAWGYSLTRWRYVDQGFKTTYAVEHLGPDGTRVPTILVVGGADASWALYPPAPWPGDIVLTIDGRPVHDLAEALTALIGRDVELARRTGGTPTEAIRGGRQTGPRTSRVLVWRLGAPAFVQISTDLRGVRLEDVARARN